MVIMETNINKLSFKAGLNNSIIKQASNINIVSCENNFYNNYRIDAFFMKDRTNCFCNNTTIELFKTLSNKLHFPLLLPPSIRCYLSKPKIQTNNNFCIATNTKVFDNELPFEACSLFFLKQHSIENLNNNIEQRYKNKEMSSNHFLADTIHEWIHSLHLGFILNSDNARNKINNLTKFKLNKQERAVVNDILGKHASNNQNTAFEIIAETFTQTICKSLNKNLELIKNPIELLKNYPKELRNILRSIILQS